MDKPRIYRALKKLQYLLSLKQGGEDEEGKLSAGLLAILALYLRNKDSLIFKNDFINELRNHYYGYVRQRVGTDHISARMEQLIQEELSFQEEFLGEFAKDLDGGKISEAMARARAKQYASSLGKLSSRINLELASPRTLYEWRLSPAEHCASCLELDGSVHSAEWYRAHGLYPKSPQLICSQNCKCYWVAV